MRERRSKSVYICVGEFTEPKMWGNDVKFESSLISLFSCLLFEERLGVVCYLLMKFDRGIKQG